MPRRRDRFEVIRGDAEMMAVGDAGERDAVLARALDRFAHRERARREREPAPRIDEHRAAALRATITGTASPSARPLRRCVAYCGTRDMPCDDEPCASASTSARAVRARHRRARAGARRARACARSLQLGEREPSACRHRRAPSAAATLSAISVDTRSFDSRVTPAMCGVRIRFGQPASGEPAGSGSLLEHVERRAAEPAARAAPPRPRPRRRRRRARC